MRSCKFRIDAMFASTQSTKTHLISWMLQSYTLLRCELSLLFRISYFAYISLTPMRMFHLSLWIISKHITMQRFLSDCKLITIRRVSGWMRTTKRKEKGGKEREIWKYLLLFPMRNLNFRNLSCYSSAYSVPFGILLLWKDIKLTHIASFKTTRNHINYGMAA